VQSIVRLAARSSTTRRPAKSRAHRLYDNQTSALRDALKHTHEPESWGDVAPLMRDATRHGDLRYVRERVSRRYPEPTRREWRDLSARAEMEAAANDLRVSVCIHTGAQELDLVSEDRPDEAWPHILDMSPDDATVAYALAVSLPEVAARRREHERSTTERAILDRLAEIAGVEPNALRAARRMPAVVRDEAGRMVALGEWRGTDVAAALKVSRAAVTGWKPGT
jgi:hypothetical protein